MGNNTGKNVEHRTIVLDTKYIEEVIDYTGRSLCGKLLKRFEIVENKEVLKNITKELIYEQLRQFRDILLAYGRGLEMTTFKFKRD